MAPSHASYKRKASSPASSIDDELHDESHSFRHTAGSGSDLVPSTKPGEPPVTKRTLQNRKAQREFRKRREARVKDLEERCRRFDQMGLEANTELQNVARRFKKENGALKSLLVRLGYGNMIAAAIDGIGEGAYEESSGETSSEGSQRQDLSSAVALSNREQYTPLDAPPGSVNPGMLEPLSTNMPQSGAMNVRWTDDSRPAGWEISALTHQQQEQQQLKPRSTPPQSISSGSDHHRATGLLSLNFEGGEAVQSMPSRQHLQIPLQLQSQAQPQPQSQHQPPAASDGITPTTFSSLMGILGEQSNNAHSAQQQDQKQSLGGGSAFLKNMAAAPQGPNTPNGYGMAHRPHQNDALLNPNPIPFAVNLSNEPAPEQSWWDRHGGGMFGGDSYLDEKANAVAQASAGQMNNGSQSPFDISAFLTSGHTPGAGFNFSTNMPTGFTPALASSNNNLDPLSQAGAALKNGKEPASSSSRSVPYKHFSSGATATQLGPADHVQVFLRTLERRAICAGEQRGQHQHNCRQVGEEHSNSGFNWMEMKSDISSDDSSAGGSRNNSPRGERLTPNTAYSRLAQHPVFLRTDVGQLEELINSIPAASIATVNAQGSGSGAPLEVDACALDVLLAMLDHLARFGELKGKNGNRSGGGGHRGPSIKAEQ